eukprot:351946-Chlamydomonas_euryale.AAC.4
MDGWIAGEAEAGGQGGGGREGGGEFEGRKKPGGAREVCMRARINAFAGRATQLYGTHACTQ